jgi:rhamnose transport system substrate-binding protein
MKIRFLTITTVLMLILGMALGACAPEAEETPAVEEPAEEEPMEEEEPAEEEPAEEAACDGFVLVPKNLGNPYFDTGNTGAQEAAGELGIEVTYQGSATADATEQITLLNSLIAQNVCGLAISANDADALVPTGQAAMDAGIAVVTWDSAIAPAGRDIHINQAELEGIAQVQLEMASRLAGEDGGEIAILSATSTAPNQNAWIAEMEDMLANNEEFANLELVEIVYGDDEDEKSYNEAQALFTKYPDLEVIIAPTTVGIAASARAVTDADLIGQVFVTGLGTPNQMREYVKNGAAPEFALWNPADLAYLAIFTTHALATGEIEAAAGETFTAGRLGEYTVEDDPDLGLNVLLGPPFVYNAENIDDFDW